MSYSWAELFRVQTKLLDPMAQDILTRAPGLPEPLVSAPLLRPICSPTSVLNGPAGPAEGHAGAGVGIEIQSRGLA